VRLLCAAAVCCCVLLLVCDAACVLLLRTAAVCCCCCVLLLLLCSAAVFCCCYSTVHIYHPDLLSVLPLPLFQISNTHTHTHIHSHGSDDSEDFDVSRFNYAMVGWLECLQELGDHFTDQQDEQLFQLPYQVHPGETTRAWEAGTHCMHACVHHVRMEASRFRFIFTSPPIK
jgi:hypothetical protein